MKMYCLEHILFLVAAVLLSGLIFFLTLKFLKSEKARVIILKIFAFLLLASIVANRVFICLKTTTPNWLELIPDTFCGMTSLVLALATLFGRKDNNVLHFVWLMGLVGGLITMFYPTFISQNASFFYLPTITGLVHHFLSVFVALGLLLYRYINITYKKWYCMFFGFTTYVAFGTFLITFLDYADAFNILTPFATIAGTPITLWYAVPIYTAVYAVALAVFQIVKRTRAKRRANV